MAPAQLDGHPNELRRGVAARDWFIAGREARPKLLIWVLGEPKRESVRALILALTRLGVGGCGAGAAGDHR